MIIGWFSFAGKPFVKARVIIPRLGVQREVEFLVDTGADRTCLNHRDAANMGLFPEILRGSEMTHAEGVGGGRARYFREDARLDFIDTDDGQPHGRTLRLLIADMSDTPSPIPSLLGRDVLHLYRMVYAPAERRLELDAPSS